MQIRLANMPQIEPQHRTGVYAFLLDGSIHTWNDRISSLFSDADYEWIDISDGDVKAPVDVLAPGSVASNKVMSLCWSSRGVENMLLHPTCALWFVQNDFEVASNAFLQIFRSMSSNFFGSSGHTAQVTLPRHRVVREECWRGLESMAQDRF
jgi:hypothetical protein